MKLPHLQHPEHYRGLYVVDFGDWAAVGYTADEVAMLLESATYAQAKVYRIAQARADGTLEMIGVLRDRLLLEAGLLFFRRNLDDARKDYQDIRGLSEASPLPCRCQLFLAQMTPDDSRPYVVGLAYSAEFDREISTWMLEHEVMAGDYAEGGVARLQNVRAHGQVIESMPLQAAGAFQPRSREEVLASVREPVQRTA